MKRKLSHARDRRIPAPRVETRRNMEKHGEHAILHYAGFRNYTVRSVKYADEIREIRAS